MAENTPSQFRVEDADTVYRDKESLRFAGGDAAEKDTAAGQTAKAFTESVVQDYSQVERHGYDKYGRTVAELRNPETGESLNNRMIRDGQMRAVDWDRAGPAFQYRNANIARTIHDARKDDRRPEFVQRASRQESPQAAAINKFHRDKPAPPRTLLQEMGASMGQSIDNIQGSYGATLAAVGDLLADNSDGRNPLGVKKQHQSARDKVTNWMQRTGMGIYRRNEAEAAAHNFDRTTFEEVMDDPGKTLRWAFGVIGEALPSVFDTALGALAGAGAGATVKKTLMEVALRRFQSATRKQLLARGVAAQSADNVAQRGAAILAHRLNKTMPGAVAGARTGGAAVAGAQMAGQTYTNIFNEYGVRAPGSALAAGAVGGSLEVFGIEAILRKFFADTKAAKGVIRSALEGAGLGAAVEGSTEVSQEFVQAVAEEANNPEWDGTAEQLAERLTSPERRSQYLEALAAGVLFGGVFGTAGGAASGAVGKLGQQQQGGGEQLATGNQAADTEQRVAPQFERLAPGMFLVDAKDNLFQVTAKYERDGARFLTMGEVPNEETRGVTEADLTSKYTVPDQDEARALWDEAYGQETDAATDQAAGATQPGVTQTGAAQPGTRTSQAGTTQGTPTAAGQPGTPSAPAEAGTGDNPPPPGTAPDAAGREPTPTPPAPGSTPSSPQPGGTDGRIDPASDGVDPQADAVVEPSADPVVASGDDTTPIDTTNWTPEQVKLWDQVIKLVGEGDISAASALNDELYETGLMDNLAPLGIVSGPDLKERLEQEAALRATPAADPTPTPVTPPAPDRPRNIKDFETDINAAYDMALGNGQTLFDGVEDAEGLNAPAFQDRVLDQIGVTPRTQQERAAFKQALERVWKDTRKRKAAAPTPVIPPAADPSTPTDPPTAADPPHPNFDNVKRVFVDGDWSGVDTTESVLQLYRDAVAAYARLKQTDPHDLTTQELGHALAMASGGPDHWTNLREGTEFEDLSKDKQETLWMRLQNILKGEPETPDLDPSEALSPSEDARQELVDRIYELSDDLEGMYEQGRTGMDLFSKETLLETLNRELAEMDRAAGGPPAAGTPAPKPPAPKPPAPPTGKATYAPSVRPDTVVPSWESDKLRALRENYERLAEGKTPYELGGGKPWLALLRYRTAYVEELAENDPTSTPPWERSPSDVAAEFDTLPDTNPSEEQFRKGMLLLDESWLGIGSSYAFVNRERIDAHRKIVDKLRAWLPAAPDKAAAGMLKAKIAGNEQTLDTAEIVLTIKERGYRYNKLGANGAILGDYKGPPLSSTNKYAVHEIRLDDVANALVVIVKNKDGEYAALNYRYKGDAKEGYQFKESGARVKTITFDEDGGYQPAARLGPPKFLPFGAPRSTELLGDKLLGLLVDFNRTGFKGLHEPALAITKALGPRKTPAAPGKVDLGNRAATAFDGKDQKKSDLATKFIGRGVAGSATEDYRAAWGDRANTGEYTADDVVFVSVNGKRKGRKDFDKAEVGKAITAKATIVADHPDHRGRAHNLPGEGPLAEFLTEQGYVETPKVEGKTKWSEWRPAPKKPAAKPDPTPTADDEKIAKIKAQRAEREAEEAAKKKAAQNKVAEEPAAAYSVEGSPVAIPEALAGNQLYVKVAEALDAGDREAARVALRDGLRESTAQALQILKWGNDQRVAPDLKNTKTERARSVQLLLRMIGEVEAPKIDPSTHRSEQGGPVSERDARTKEVEEELNQFGEDGTAIDTDGDETPVDLEALDSSGTPTELTGSPELGVADAEPLGDSQSRAIENLVRPIRFMMRSQTRVKVGEETLDDGTKKPIYDTRAGTVESFEFPAYNEAKGEALDAAIERGEKDGDWRKVDLTVDPGDPLFNAIHRQLQVALLDLSFRRAMQRVESNVTLYLKRIDTPDGARYVVKAEEHIPYLEGDQVMVSPTSRQLANASDVLEDEISLMAQKTDSKTHELALQRLVRQDTPGVMQMLDALDAMKEHDTIADVAAALEKMDGWDALWAYAKRELGTGDKLETVLTRLKKDQRENGFVKGGSVRFNSYDLVRLGKRMMVNHDGGTNDTLTLRDFLVEGLTFLYERYNPMVPTVVEHLNDPKLKLAGMDNPTTLGEHLERIKTLNVLGEALNEAQQAFYDVLDATATSKEVDAAAADQKEVARKNKLQKGIAAARREHRQGIGRMKAARKALHAAKDDKSRARAREQLKKVLQELAKLEGRIRGMLKAVDTPRSEYGKAKAALDEAVNLYNRELGATSKRQPRFDGPPGIDTHGFEGENRASTTDIDEGKNLERVFRNDENLPGPTTPSVVNQPPGEAEIRAAESTELPGKTGDPTPFTKQLHAYMKSALQGQTLTAKDTALGRLLGPVVQLLGMEKLPVSIGFATTADLKRLADFAADNNEFELATELRARLKVAEIEGMRSFTLFIDDSAYLVMDRALMDQITRGTSKGARWTAISQAARHQLYHELAHVFLRSRLGDTMARNRALWNKIKAQAGKESPAEWAANQLMSWVEGKKPKNRVEAFIAQLRLLLQRVARTLGLTGRSTKFDNIMHQIFAAVAYQEMAYHTQKFDTQSLTGVLDLKDLKKLLDTETTPDQLARAVSNALRERRAMVSKRFDTEASVAAETDGLNQTGVNVLDVLDRLPDAALRTDNFIIDNWTPPFYDAVRRSVVGRILTGAKDIARDTTQFMHERLTQTADRRLRSQTNPDGEPLLAMRAVADLFRPDIGLPRQVLQVNADLSIDFTGDQFREGFFPAMHRVHGTFVHSRLVPWFNALPKKKAERQQKLTDVRHELITGNLVSAEAKTLRRWFDDMWEYASTHIPQLGQVAQNYFPRVYDTDKLKDRKAEFIALLVKHQIDPKDAEGVWSNLVDGNGLQDLSALNAVLTPTASGRAHRGDVLRGIPDTELEMFFVDDVEGALVQYAHQMIKRAEFERLMGGWQLIGVEGPSLRPDQVGGVKRVPSAKGGFHHEVLIGNVWTKAYWDHLALYTDLRKDAFAKGAQPHQLALLDETMNAYMGRLGQDLTPGARTTISTLIAWTNWLLLPLSFFSSMVDAGNPVLRTNGNMRVAWNGMRAAIRAWREKDQSMLYRMAVVNGHVARGHIAQVANNYYDSPWLTGKASQWNETLFKYNGMQVWTQFSRTYAMATGVEWFKDLASKNDAESKRLLDDFGLSAAEVRSWVAGGMQGWVEGQVGGSKKMTDALNRFVYESTLTPDASQRPNWGSSPVLALFFHLKSFAFSFYDIILRRMINEFKKAKGVKRKAIIAAMPFAVLMPLAMFGTMLRDMLRYGLPWQEERPDWQGKTSLEYTWWMIDRAGLLGPAQIGLSAWQSAEFGGNFIFSLAGPTAEHILVNPYRMGLEQWMARSIPLLPVFPTERSAVTGGLQGFFGDEE